MAEKGQGAAYDIKSVAFRKFGEIVLPVSYTHTEPLRQSLRASKDLLVISNVCGFIIMLDPEGIESSPRTLI